MTVDEMRHLVEPIQTLQDRVASRPSSIPIDLTTQYLGNRVVSRFFPEHYARVQIARRTLERYRDPS